MPPTIIDLSPSDWRIIPPGALPPPSDRVRPLIGNPFLLLPWRWRRGPIYMPPPHPDLATRMFHRMMIKSFGLLFDLLQWGVATWFIVQMEADNPKIGLGAIAFTAWIAARICTYFCVVLPWRILTALCHGVWHLLAARDS
jgi:hypothetical protein